jgi:hypothetical protein
MLTMLTAACGGGDDLLLPGSAEPATVTLLQGADQNGRVGEALPQPLVAAVADATGRPVEGATLVFVLADPAPGAVVTPDTVRTDADGQATASVVLGTRPGAQQGEIMALGSAGSPVAQTSFTVTALSNEAAATLAPVGGLGQSAPVGSVLAEPLVVSVTDPFGNPIEGVTVSWSADGGGTVSAAATTTGADGTAAVERTLGPTAGTQRTFASVDGVVGSPVTFIHTATAGAASGVRIVAGNGQSGPVGSRLPTTLAVEVRDAAGNAVPGVAVAWVVGTGGGSAAPSTSTTDAAGRAGTVWTLGSAPGANTLSAVVSGIGVAEFGATATAGAAGRLAMVTQPPGAATVGVPLETAPAVQLLDAGGNPVRQAGVTIQAAIGSGGGSLSGTTAQPTDGNGVASFPGLVIQGSAGTKTLRFSGSGIEPVTSGAITVAAAPAPTLAIAQQPSGAAVAGVPFDQQPVIQLQDGSGAALGQAGVVVTAAIASGGPALSGTATATTDTQGRASFTDLGITGDPGSRTLAFTASGFEGATSAAVAVSAPPPGPPDASRSSVTVEPSGITVGQTSAITVIVRDAAGTPLAGQSVQVTATGDNNTITNNPGTTGDDGSVVFAFSSSSAGDKTITAAAGGVTLGSAQGITVTDVPTTGAARSRSR